MLKYLFAAFGCIIFFAAAQPAKADVVVSAINAGLCVDVNQSNNTLALWQCHGGANQTFFSGAYGPQRLGNLCMETINPRNSAFGGMAADLVMRPCNNSPGQRWVLDNSNGEFRNEQGYCLDIPFRQANQGSRIQGHTCNRGNNQKWARGGFARAPNPTVAAAPAGTVFNSAGQRIGISGNATTQGGGGNIVAAGGGNIVAAGGGNIVAAGGGNIVAAGGGN